MGLGDLVMTEKEHWRKHVGALDLEGFPKAWIQQGLREIHHVNDNMDGRMDACVGYTAILGAKIFKSMGELHEMLREDQKKRALDGWEQMDMKRQLEDSLHEAQGEISDLKPWVDTLEFLVEKLTHPAPEVPHEAVFCPASPPLPDISFPPLMEIPGLTRLLLITSLIGHLSIDLGLMEGTRQMSRRMGMGPPTRRMSGSLSWLMSR